MFLEDDQAAQCVLRPLVTSLFCAVSILYATNLPRPGKEEDMYPSLLTGCGRAWMMRSPSRLDSGQSIVWTH